MLLGLSSPVFIRQEISQKNHTFIFSCLDYFNSLYTCLSHAALSRLKLVQNLDTRLLTRTCRWPRIHRLSVQFRIDYTILLIIFNILFDLAPVTLLISLLFIPLLNHFYPHISTTSNPLSNHKTNGERAYTVFALTRRNNHPQSIRFVANKALLILPSYIFMMLFSLFFNKNSFECSEDCYTFLGCVHCIFNSAVFALLVNHELKLIQPSSLWSQHFFTLEKAFNRIEARL